MDEQLWALSATAAAELIAKGRLTSVEFTRACIERIEQREPEIGAWEFLDREHALRQAEVRDQEHLAGKAQGPLHGVPVGIKDIFDTTDMPTQLGSALHVGRRPMDDSAVVARLREAGAVILGKTVTTEFAGYHPGKTRNPVDPSRTPGGSSSGSAAAVASGMVPIAIGSQSNGSLIRPASYCGVVGFKPTFGLISRSGMARQHHELDQVGIFARTVEDAACVTECLIGYDEDDADTRASARPPLLAVCRDEPPVPARIAILRLQWADRLEPEAAAAYAELVDVLGPHAVEVPLPDVLAEAQARHAILHEVGVAVNLASDFTRGAATMSSQLRAMIDRGHKHGAYDYASALAALPRDRALLDELLSDFDAAVVPAATGAAPRGLDSTGDPVFSTLWTLCGVPAVTLPLLATEGGLPLGVQLVAPRRTDARLLRTARWLANFVAKPARKRRR
jgi:Asp-tRNA(Asn)/Glu-tRNA(Gln) amidotransferase A subunit family amidase